MTERPRSPGVPTEPADWPHLEPGQEVALRHFKWVDRAPRRTGTGTVSHATPAQLAVLVLDLAEGTGGDGTSINAYADGIFHFIPQAWFNVVEYDRWRPHWYCNVATPVTVDGATISWIDLDLDVEFFSDGTWWISDIANLAVTRAAYPADVVDAAVQAVGSLVDLFETHTAPFDTGRGEAGAYSQYDHAF